MQHYWSNRDHALCGMYPRTACSHRLYTELVQPAEIKQKKWDAPRKTVRFNDLPQVHEISDPDIPLLPPSRSTRPSFKYNHKHAYVINALLLIALSYAAGQFV